MNVCVHMQRINMYYTSTTSRPDHIFNYHAVYVNVRRISKMQERHTKQSHTIQNI